MSHFTELTVDFEQKNEKEFIASLEEVFGKGSIVVNSEGTPLYGYQGDNRSRLSKDNPNYAPLCHIVVKKNAISSASNDVGYVRTEDGKYKAYISEYDTPGYIKKQKKVRQNYTTEVTKKTLKKMGYTAKVDVQKDGTIKIKAYKY